MEAVLPIAQPKEDHLSKPTIRIEIPLLSGKSSNAPTIVDIAEVMAKYREQLGESSEDEDYEDGMEEEGLEGEEDDDEEDSDSSDDDDDEEDSLDEIEERELSPSEIENMLPAGPKTNRYTGVIERIERMYGGEYSKGRKQDDYDFEDSFIDDSDWKTYTDAPKTKHDGFFINKGTLELASEESESSAQAFEGQKKKRKRSLDKDGKEIKAKESSGDDKNGKGDKKERPKKKTKTGSADSSPAKEGEGKKGSKIQALAFQSASPSSTSSGQFAAPKPKAPTAALSPSVESAIQALERAIPLHPLAEGGKKRLPRELDAHLYQVALEARKTHPHGHIAANVTQRLIKSLPFNERTLKHHMKRVLESKTEEEEESLEAKIGALLDELKTKVDKMRALNPTAKWKWDRETGNLLHTIFEMVDNRVELHNKLHEKDTELKLSDRKERKKVADEIAKFWPADQMTGADILKKNTIIKSNRKRATGKPDGGSTIEGKEKEKEKEKEKKDGKRDNDKSKADKKEKKQQKKEEKKKEEKRKEEKKLRKEEKKKKSADKKASSDDRKVAAERKPSPTTAPQPLASPPPTTAAQAQPSVTPIVRQAVPLPPLPSVITRVTAEEDDDVIILS